MPEYNMILHTATISYTFTVVQALIQIFKLLNTGADYNSDYFPLRALRNDELAVT